MTLSAEDGAICWLHLGDQHLVERQGQNFEDFCALVGAARRDLAGVDFAYMPGDVAEHGTAQEYDLARVALADLDIPLFVVPGDHDMHPRRLDAFRAAFPRPLPFAQDFAGRRCLFLDMVSQGAGGPDFRLGAAQLDWLGRELASADTAGGAILFQHAYPADLADAAEREALIGLLARHRVYACDMGHTHYNELAHDGRTIFAATRSIGQVEEGPVGYSLMAVGPDGSVSWRFRPLATQGPLCLIVSPADRRLARDEAYARAPRLQVNALAFPASRIARGRLRGADEDWRPLTRLGPRGWVCEIDGPSRPVRLTVEVEDIDGATDRDTIEVWPPGHGARPQRTGRGSDADSLGAWPERLIPGGQLGPNRNGRKW